ncbi:DsrH/TusB family sulfur metabolism protein, partial [Pseudomonas syringae pv. tagetis]|uniref:DsrH/TusB family sulfur metabolism protein n=1 Tax=Pseudomonas syringae group genomosp. 7 TaxID=251699 RepID=UPI00376F67CD
MAALHVLSHSPFAATRLDSCLRLLGNDYGVLLCGDATYALMPSRAPFLAVQRLFGA